MQIAPKFPVTLLTASNKDKLDYFSRCTVVHRKLRSAYSQFLDAVSNPGGASLVLLFGPTGVGKTTFLNQIVRLLIEKHQTEIELDSAFFPVATVEARSPESGSFDWKDYYKNVLIALSDPFVDYKLRTRSSRVYGTASQQIIAKVTPNLVDLRADVENIFKQRRLAVFLIDEAQRFAKMASGRRQKDQMDAIQSMASFTSTLRGLFGTYELLELRNLSGQLSRRSLDIHFPRYQIENPEDIKDFQRVLKSFASFMPLDKTPDLEKKWEFFYERSIGCVGIVKDWLMKAYQKALSESDQTLLEKHLIDSAPMASKSLQILTEAIEGEKMFKEDSSFRDLLRQKLGLTSKNDLYNGESLHQVTQKTKRRPGKRNPQRDVVVGGENKL